MENLLQNKKTEVKAGAIGQGIRTSETNMLNEQTQPQSSINVQSEPSNTPTPQPVSQNHQTTNQSVGNQQVAQPRVMEKRERGNDEMKKADEGIVEENKKIDKKRLKDEKKANVRAKARAIADGNKTTNTAQAQSQHQQTQTDDSLSQPQQSDNGIKEEDYTFTEDELRNDPDGPLYNDAHSTDTKEDNTESQPRTMSYVDMYKALNPEVVETPEQQALREKKEKRERIARSIADGLNAIARIYYGSKGVGIPHDPKTDLTNSYNARQELLKKQYKENKYAWLNGYLKAQALDEQSRRYSEQQAETKRHNKTMENLNDRKAGQSDRRMDQNDRKLNIYEKKIQNDKDYNNLKLEIEKKLADGQIKHWEAMQALGWARLQEAKRRGNNDSNLTGVWNTFLTMMDEDPTAEEKVDKIIEDSHGAIKKPNNTNIRFIVGKLLGFGSSTHQSKPKLHNAPSKTQNKTSTRSASKPKTQNKPVPRQQQNIKQRSRNL